ncbi:unnamed protein product [Discula destructiva]
MASTTLAATGSASHYIALAQKLPDRLLRFFARYPPPQILGDGPHQPTGYQLATKNPFKPQKHEYTGRVHRPVYSNRRQADLVKLAQEHGVGALMPPSKKSAEHRLAKKVALGWRGKGTGVGQTVKGHKHERMLGAKMDKRREAMLKMPALIREWKAVGRKNWTRWPK